MTTTDFRATSDPSGTTRDSGSRVARAVWITLGGILAIAALGWGTYSVISLLAHQEYTQRSTFTADQVNALRVDNENGAVSVTAADSDTVTVVAEVSDGWKATTVTTEVIDGVLELSAECPVFVSPWCSVDFTVSIPADRPITVDGAGAVLVRGFSAPIDVDSDDGRLELEDISGPIVASNDDGRIVGRRLTAPIVDATNHHGSIELSFIDPPRSVTALRTTNGSIDVIVPDTDVLYRVELNTSHGGTDNLVRTDPNSDHVIDLSTRNGSLTVRPPG